MINTVKVCRAEKNWSQEDLAYKVGVSRNTINSVENGKSIPKIDLVLKIANVFGKKVEDIFFTNDGNLDCHENYTA